MSFTIEKGYHETRRESWVVNPPVYARDLPEIFISRTYTAKVHLAEPLSAELWQKVKAANTPLVRGWFGRTRKVVLGELYSPDNLTVLATFDTAQSRDEFAEAVSTALVGLS